MSDEDAAMMRTAVSVWLRSAPRGVPEGLTQTVGNLLDSAMGAAHRWAEPDLAACLMILALSRYERADGPACCLRALRHSLAELQLDLPMGEAIGPMRPMGRIGPIGGPHGIDLERAKDLCALMSDLGYDAPLETVRGYTAEQADQAENYCRRYKLRLTTPIDVPERPPFFPPM